MSTEGGDQWRAQNASVMEKIREKLERAETKLEGIATKVRGRRQWPRSPYLGETVLYKMPDGPTVGELRPGIVLRVHDNGMVDLRVITDTECDPAMGVVRLVKRGHHLAHWHVIGETLPLEDES